MTIRPIALAALLLLAAGSARAGVPSQIDAQGVLRDATGDVIDLPDATLLFRLYDAATGGELLWSETQEDVPIVMGVFDTLLPANALTELPANVQGKLATGAPLWLSVQLEGQAELPRTAIVSVPYAFTANRALVAAGLDCSGCIDASDINTSTFAAQHLGYTPGADDLVTATNVGGAIGELDGYLKDHIANPDAHHAADSSGIAIKPTSVTIGDTRLEDGVLDLGPGAGDALTAAQVQTLTGGGNADALHKHTASSITGMSQGSCFVAWNSQSCPMGWTAAYTGSATAMFATNSPSVWTNGHMTGVSDTICAKDMPFQGTTLAQYVAWLSPASHTGYSYGTAYNQSATMPCAMCCPASEEVAGCVTSYSGKAYVNLATHHSWGSSPFTSFRSKVFTLASTYTNRTYRILRMNVALTTVHTANSTTPFDLRVVDGSGTQIGQWPLVYTGANTTSADHSYNCTGTSVCSYNWPIYSAQVDFAYVGGDPIALEVINVETQTASVPYIGDTNGCVDGRCTPWHSASGCAQ